VLHSPSLAVCSKPTDLPIEKSKHQREELSYFFAWNFLVYSLGSHFFQLEYMQLQEILELRIEKS